MDHAPVTARRCRRCRRCIPAYSKEIEDGPKEINITSRKRCKRSPASPAEHTCPPSNVAQQPRKLGLKGSTTACRRALTPSLYPARLRPVHAIPRARPHLEVFHTVEDAISGTPARSVAHLPILFRCLRTRPAADQPRGRWLREAFVSLIGRLHRAKAELSDGENDPWRRALERSLPANLVCTSTVALLALLDFPATTGNARRLARTMRSMGWVGIKSRRLAPGGWRTTTCRGWARPFREMKLKKHAYHV